jgi:hypothetical protein
MADYNLTADGSTAALQFQGEGSVNATGTFGGGTLSIEASFDGGTTWVAQTDGEFTAAGTLNIKQQARLILRSARAICAQRLQAPRRQTLT